jgi:hypothetical protein
MKCKRAEKLIIEEAQTKPDPEIKAALDAHVLNCPKCSSFKEKLQWINQEIHQIKTPEPSPEILEKTGALCHIELIDQGKRYIFEKYQPDKIKIPRFVWIAIALLFVLTIAWAAPVIREVLKSQIITKQSIIILLLFVQNLMVLVFSPVLLRSQKLKSYNINFQP